jgi:hypothetical protein
MPFRTTDRVQSLGVALDYLHHAGITQRLEFFVANEDVGGSNPPTCSHISERPPMAQNHFAGAVSSSVVIPIVEGMNTDISTAYVQIDPSGSWTGSIVVNKKVPGGNASYPLGYKKADESIGTSPITAAGIYSFDISGGACELVHTVGTGKAIINISVVKGSNR